MGIDSLHLNKVTLIMNKSPYFVKGICILVFYQASFSHNLLVYWLSENRENCNWRSVVEMQTVL